MRTILVSAILFQLVWSVTATAAAGGKKHRGPDWVPYRAWKAVEKVAHKGFNPEARLFKTKLTKQDSRGLAGKYSQAFIVGARRPDDVQKPDLHFMPFRPKQVFYLVTKNSRKHWKVTPLATIWRNKVDAASKHARAGFGVGFNNPADVCGAVEIQNAAQVKVTQGTQLAHKAMGENKHLVFMQGKKPAPNKMYWGEVHGTINAKVPRKMCGMVIHQDKKIPVTFGQIYY